MPPTPVYLLLVPLIGFLLLLYGSLNSGAFATNNAPHPGGESALLAQYANRCSVSSVAALSSRYEGIANDLDRHGLDVEAVWRSRQSFVISDGNIRPRHYAEAPWLLPPRSVRLLAFEVSNDERVSGANTSRVARLAMTASR